MKNIYNSPRLAAYIHEMFLKRKTEPLVKEYTSELKEYDDMNWEQYRETTTTVSYSREWLDLTAVKIAGLWRVSYSFNGGEYCVIYAPNIYTVLQKFD